jgi:hypothetical protein
MIRLNARPTGWFCDQERQRSAWTVWARKPLERPLSDVIRVTVDANVDRASGVELCSTMLVMRDGSAWALPHTDRKNATAAADAARDFLGITT